MAQSTCPFRVGHGHDIHRLQAGGELVLGGVVVAQGISPVAHSDGDVVIHALVDALLGAAGRGDIGRHFPDTDPRFAGASSLLFLDQVIAELKQIGLGVVNVDLTVQAEKPKLAPFRERIVQVLQERVGGAVNLKAGTNEGCDAVGRGEAIACHAVVLLARAE